MRGAVILITHDRSLMEMVADRLWLTADGTIAPFDGDMEDYARFVLDRAKTAGKAPIEAPKAPEAPPAPARTGKVPTGPARRRAEAAEAALGRATRPSRRSTPPWPIPPSSPRRSAPPILAVAAPKPRPPWLRRKRNGWRRRKPMRRLKPAVSPSGLFFPAALVALAPIGHRMAGALQRGPAPARRGGQLLVAASNRMTQRS